MKYLQLKRFEIEEDVKYLNIIELKEKTIKEKI